MSTVRDCQSLCVCVCVHVCAREDNVFAKRVIAPRLGRGTIASRVEVSFNSTSYGGTMPAGLSVCVISHISKDLAVSLWRLKAFVSLLRGRTFQSV